MIDTPAFAQFVAQRLQPFQIMVDNANRIVSTSGDASTYGLDDCRPGTAAEHALPFLIGIETDTVFELPLLAMPSGRRAHVLLSPVAGGYAVLLIDATSEWQQQRELQQKANELHLLSEQQQRLVARLEQMQVELRASRDAAEQASRLKSEFIARMSHEFRTPLTSIIGHARRQVAAATAVGVAAAAASIERGATHLLNLVENLLDEAQLRSGEILIQPRATAVASVFEELRDYFAPLAEDKALTFEVGGAAALPPSVLLDDMRLRQILINLIGNAIKYTERGEVSVTSRWADDELEVRISDQGPGISDAAQEKIFGAFWRESNNAPGAGLGLSISRSLVELMAGHIELESELGVGTSVTVKLPAPIATVYAAPASETFDIVLAEDSFDVAQLLTLSLSEAGYSMTHYATAGETLARCRERAPDLVIVDRNLSDMSGFEVTRRLRAAGYVRPVVMLTASNLVDDRDRAQAAGCDDFLVKSAGLAPLLESVNRLASQRG